MIGVYPIGVPLLYFCLLWSKRDKLDPGQKIYEKTMSEEEALKKALIDRARNEAEDPTLKSLAFLYASYEPKRFYFEVFETLRKLALTGFLVFLVPGTCGQIVISMLMCLVSMRVYSGCKPFIDVSHDRLSETTQWQLFLTQLGALAMKANLDGENLTSKMFFDLTLSLLQVVPAAIMLLFNVYETNQTVKEALLERKMKNKQHASSEGDATSEKRIDEEEGEGIQLDTFNPVASKSQTKNRIINKAVSFSDASPGATGDMDSFSFNNPMLKRG